MVDFLKANPFVTMEDYKWKLSVPMIRLMSIDNTHINYLSDKQIEMRKAKKINKDNIGQFNDLGLPILGGSDKNE